MKSYSNQITNQICTMLAPLVGDMMAGGIIKSQAAKIGFTEDNISAEHLPVLADGIEKGLVIFLGTDVARQIGTKIREIK